MSDEAKTMSPFTEARDLIRSLDDLSYDMLHHAKSDDLCALIEKLKQWGCKAEGHEWIFDQCGYWQHQYCVECHGSKYPDLAKKNCHDLTTEMDGMSEAEYLRRLQP
jgi:hypothetical protein